MSSVFQFQVNAKDYSTVELYLESARKYDVKLELVDDFAIKDVVAGHEAELKASGLINSVHGVFFDINPASNNIQIREISKHQIEESCRFAESIGAKNIIFHSSCISFLRGPYLDAWLKISAEFFTRLASSTSLQIFIENSQDVDSEPIRKLMELCNGKLKCCLDIGHVNYSRENFEDWIDNLKPFIGYFHYSDNMGLFDKHLLLGEGTVDWTKVIKATEFFADREDVPITFEVGDLENSVKALDFLKTGIFINKASALKVNALENKIVRDISVGIFAIGFDGVIWYVNRAATKLLGKKEEDLKGRLFASCFLEYSENDAFNQIIIDAICDHSKSHKKVVDFYTGKEAKKLHVETSFSIENGNKLGIIVTLSDMSEIVELRDSLKSMNKIKELNDKLEIRNKLIGDTFGRYLSDSIVRQILDSPNGLKMGGEKKHMTVMMTDLRGFTKMCENMEAQNLVEMINHYFGEMTAVISSFNGTIIEFIGDAILVIFGAPAEDKNHASDAIAAAIAMQKRMETVNTWNTAKGFPVLKMGIGICTGDMIVGNIGSIRHAKYGVIGSNVNLCGRIESYTTEGQVYISDATLKEAGSAVGVEETIEISPKGIKDKIFIHRIVSIGNPYNLSYKNIQEEPVMLDRKITVLFNTMDGKFVGTSTCQGYYTALSEKSAILETSYPLKRFENISISSPKERFAKVTAVDGKNLYRIIFTSF